MGRRSPLPYAVWGAPTSGIPASPGASMDVTDQRRSSHVAALSPDQCAAYAPVPGKLDLPNDQARLRPGCWEAAEALTIDAACLAGHWQ